MAQTYVTESGSNLRDNPGSLLYCKTQKYGRNTRTIYYDVTNFFFEIDTPDELRKHGLSKEGRRDPIVQMGLAMDSDGIPLHYDLFPGNTVDKATFRPIIVLASTVFGMGECTLKDT